MRRHNDEAVRVDTVWTFHYHLVPWGDRRHADIKCREFHTACFEFHAGAQLVHKLGRDGYKIDLVISNHTTKGDPTPQSHGADDLPAVNPDAKTFMLPAALFRKIYPNDDAP